MSEAGRQLFIHLLSRLFPNGEWLFGFLLAFGLWCLDYAIIEARRGRFRYAFPLAVAAAGFVTVVMLPAWESRSLWRIGVAGVLFYLPLFAYTRRDAIRGGG
jgi:hypothetical protein